jgi:hypothetical protein
MPTPLHRHPRQRSAATRARAFTFTEVLFAVMILGLGFIMIAAIFPVTLSQTQATVQDVNGAAQARSGFETVANSSELPKLVPTGGANLSLSQCPVIPIAKTVPIPGANNPFEVWKDVSANFINSQNPRFGWTALYRRAANDDVAQVFIIATQCRTRSAYDPAKDILRPPITPPVEANLEPRLVGLTSLLKQADGSTELYIQKLTGQPGLRTEGIVAEGAYLIIADVQASGPGDTTRPPVTLNGRVFQLGPRINFSTNPTTPMVFKAQAGTELSVKEKGFGSVPSSKPVLAYIVGRAYSDAYLNQSSPQPPIDTDFDGVAQDIGIYVGYVKIPG